MLYSIDRDGNLREVTDVSRTAKFEEARGRLSEAQVGAVGEEIERRIGGKDRFLSGWIASDDWSATPLESIHEVACDPIGSGLATNHGIHPRVGTE